MATKQDFQRELSTPTLASADPSSSVRAIQLQGDMVKGVLSAGSTLYNQYREGQFQDIVTEAEQLPREALTSQMKAQQAGEELSLFAPTLEQKQQAVKSFDRLDTVNPVLQTEEAARNRAVGELKDYVDTAKRLTEASQQGMSPTEYMTRVQSLTKKAMGQFPGMSKEIRKAIGEATGMQYADDWAARQYVSQMFTKPKQEDQSKLIDMDHKAIYENLGVSMTDVLSVYKSNPTQYKQWLDKSSDIRGLEAVAKQSKLQADALSSSKGPEAIMGLQALGTEATAKSMIDFAKYQTANAQLFSTLENKVSTGALDNIDQVHTELQIISAQSTGLINKNFRSAETELDNKWANGTLNKEDYEKGKVLLKNQKDRALAQFEPANMSTVAKILVAHKDKSLTDQQKLMSTSIEFAKLFGPTELISSWFGSADDSAQRKDILKNYPQLAKVLTDLSPVLTGQYGKINTLAGQVNTVTVATTLNEARTTPTASPPIPNAPGVTAETKKASLEAVALEGDLVFKKLQKNPTALITTQDANLLGTVLNNSVAYNQPVDYIVNGTDKLAKIFTRLTPEDQSAVKSSVSANHTVTSTKVIQGTGQINKMFDTTLQIGVRPSGTIDIVPPMNLLQSIALSRPTGGYSADDLGPFASIPELKYKSIIPGKEEEFRKYSEAAKLWINTQKTRANNMVLTKSIVTGEPTNKIGGEIARYLEDKKEIPSFYSSVPAKPPEVINATSTTTPTTTGQQQPTTGAALVTPTPVGTLTTEKAAISAMQSGRQDLQREIQKLEVSLADTKPGSATYKQLEFDLQEANKVLKGLK